MPRACTIAIVCGCLDPAALGQRRLSITCRLISRLLALSAFSSAVTAFPWSNVFSSLSLLGFSEADFWVVAYFLYFV
jgi:hypothetical protein